MTADPWALLREARDFVGFLPTRTDAIEKALSIQRRIDAALAAHDAVLENEREYQARLKAEVGQLANESFRRGAEAMRTALLQRVSWGSDLADRIRDEPVPEDK